MTFEEALESEVLSLEYSVEGRKHHLHQHYISKQKIREAMEKNPALGGLLGDYLKEELGL